MRFTREEFDIMVNELLYKEPVSFEMLCKIAKKTLWSSVKSWCYIEEGLRGKRLEEDVMQDIYLRLIKKTVSGFLLRDDIAGPYNNDPEGFEDWMFTVARNLTHDNADKEKNNDINNGELDENIPLREDDDFSFVTDRLQNALNIALSSRNSVYKILTWLAQYVFILQKNVMKIKSNDLIISAFENKTLFDMYEMILHASKQIPWLTLTDTQKEKILNDLRKECKNGVLYGETKYKDFFMMDKGAPSGKKSISDWTNRINKLIEKEAGNTTETPETDNETASPNSKCKKKSSKKTVLDKKESKREEDVDDDSSNS